MSTKLFLNEYRGKRQELFRIVAALKQVGVKDTPSELSAQHTGCALSIDPTDAPIRAQDGLLMRRASLAQWFTEDREARLKAILRQAMTCELVMILTMYYEQGMTDQQIAKSLHCSREHVNKARNRFINDLH